LLVDDDVRVLALTGELDMETVDRFERALAETVDGGPVAVVADLTRLTFLDSSGLAALLGALRTLGLAGARMVVACANPTVLRLFEVTRADATFEIFSTRDQALDRAREAGAGA
jgi:anti-sigma B factor antagonist